jgi:hypothetical protein
VLASVIVVTAFGVFIWSLHLAGISAVIDAVSKVRLWFGVVLLLGGLRYLARAAAWRLCLERPSTFPLSSAFVAVAAGNAIGSVTPLGALASEPSKVLMLSARTCTHEAAAALVVENLCYVVSVLVGMSIAGALLWVALGHSARTILVAAAGALGVLTAFGFAAASLASRSHVRAALARRSAESAVGARISAALGKLDSIGNAVVKSFRTVRRRIAAIALLEAAFHLAAVGETAIVVGAMAGIQPSLVSAVILEGANRLTTVAFQFLPLRLGVDEAVSGMTAELLRVGVPIGVGLAVVRKGRVLCWSAIGFSLAAFLTRGRPAGDRPLGAGAQSPVGRNECTREPRSTEET